MGRVYGLGGGYVVPTICEAMLLADLVTKMLTLTRRLDSDLRVSGTVAVLVVMLRRRLNMQASSDSGHLLMCLAGYVGPRANAPQGNVLSQDKLELT